MMQTRRRRRFPQEHTLSVSPALIRWIGVLVVLLLVCGGLLYALHLYAPMLSGERMATELRIEGAGDVSVIIEGESSPKRAESGLRLYEGDAVLTESAGTLARLIFFDGMEMVLDGRTRVELLESIRGEERSQISVSLSEGTVWIHTGSGSATERIVYAPLARYVPPDDTRAILSTRSEGNEELREETLSVFESRGEGVVVTVSGVQGVQGGLVVGEGQKSVLPARAAEQIRTGTKDAFDFRTVLYADVPLSDFHSRVLEASVVEPVTTTVISPANPDEEQLVVSEPLDNELLESSTLLVRGRIGSQVKTVTVNGYSAELGDDGSFEKEIAVAEGESFLLEVRAEDSDGILIASEVLSLRRDIQPPEPPRITSPGAAGTVVAVSEDSFEIVGEAGSDTVGIIVNGYRLQKYEPGKPWRYWVDESIDNVKRGENIYEARAIDRSGNISDPVSITVVWKAAALSQSSTIDTTGTVVESQSYLLPGSLTVTSPTTGDTYTTDDDALAIEGVTSDRTASISINGFQLTLYEPGSTIWRYVVQDSYNNYTVGNNRYTVLARDADGEILDVLIYEIIRTQ